MTVRLIDDKALWDRTVDESPGGSIFHKWDLLHIVEKYSGYKLFPYGVYRGAELTCVFPAFFRVYRGLRLVFSPPPQTLLPYLGMVMAGTYYELRQKRKETYLTEAIREISDDLKKLSPNYVNIMTGPQLEDVRPFMWHRYEAGASYEYAIDLKRPLEDIWAGFDSTCKKNIKRCEKLGLEMRQVNDASAFYQIMGEKFSEKGHRTLYQGGDATYLKEILDAYPDHIKMYFLYDGEEVAGVHTIGEYKGKCTLWLGSASGHYNEYMLWELIKLERSRGMGLFEIPDANTERVLPFKSKFNPSLELGFLVRKKDAIGAIAEWAFANVVRSWV